MRGTHSSLRASALLFLAALGGCGGDSTDNESLASLDARLTNGAASSDPAVGNDAGAGNMGDGPTASAARNPLDGASGQASGPRLGEVAERQRSARALDRVRAATGGQAGAETDGCGRQIVYGDQWARDLPAAFAIYPGGALVEAAGVTTDRCTLRVVSFTADATPMAVARHYAGRASAAGFSAERQPCDGGYIVGGVHPGTDQAYIVMITGKPGARTDVDIVMTLG